MKRIELMKLLKTLELNSMSILPILIRQRMRIEMLKVTLFMDLAQEGIDSKFYEYYLE